MRPAARSVILLAAGIPIALLPVFLGQDFWVVWLVYVGSVLLLIGADAIFITPPGRVEIRVRAPEVLYIGEGDFLIGRHKKGIAPWLGDIADMVIVRRALSQAELKELMNKGLAQVLAVQPLGKLTTTWGIVKTGL